MLLEEHLIQKTFYKETFLKEEEKEHPVRLLGDIYMEEQGKELPDLSYIRFAQGEVYFHNRDYEAAIFKWESIHNELEPWARKNMADAYVQLELWETARDIYKSVTTDSQVLNTEVALKMYELYESQEKWQEADEMIKQAVLLYPDYKDVTKRARAFFEQQKDWDSAVEHAVNEAIRTKSPHWFGILHSYIEEGHVKSYEPAYFIPALYTLEGVDLRQFEQVISSLWSNFHGQKQYIKWLVEINHLILNSDFQKTYQWHDLSLLYKEAFYDLLGGRYFVSDLLDIMPELLAAWLKTADDETSFIAASALLGWNDVIPTAINNEIAASAEKKLHESKGNYLFLQDSADLFDLIKNWAYGHKIDVGEKLAWMVHELAQSNHVHVMVAGTSGSGKSSIVSSLLGYAGDDPEEAPVPAVFKDLEDPAIHLITDEGILAVENRGDFSQIAQGQKGIIEVGSPNSFLREHRFSVIDLPEIDWNDTWARRKLKHVQLADILLFVLHEYAPLTENERDILLKAKEECPDLAIHFVMDIRSVNSEKEAMELLEETRRRIGAVFPASKLFAYSTALEGSGQREGLAQFIHDHYDRSIMERARTANVLSLARKAIGGLLQQQTDAENELLESIRLDEEILGRMQGSIHQLQDKEEEKVFVIRQAYESIKSEIKKDLVQSLPRLLKGAAEIIKEDSDFGNIHLELNEEMNNRIEEYLQNTILPIYTSSLQDWISFSENELNETQGTMTEWAEGFNAIVGDERISLRGDFKIFDDWRRDADRMTSSLYMDKENIMLKRTPSQVLLKGAGKLLGVIPANNTVLYNRYKSFIENENYQEAAESIAIKFFRQFEMFEKAIPRDIGLFFRDPFSELKQTVAEIQREVDAKKAALEDMRSKPEAFRDPLTFFEVRIRQTEWINHAERTNAIV
ncbi:MAG TPA: GTP-binding protein [Bacillaceae bacterium]